MGKCSKTKTAAKTGAKTVSKTRANTGGLTLTKTQVERLPEMLRASVLSARNLVSKKSPIVACIDDPADLQLKTFLDTVFPITDDDFRIIEDVNAENAAEEMVVGILCDLPFL